jgi:hypothetical protein
MSSSRSDLTPNIKRALQNLEEAMIRTTTLRAFIFAAVFFLLAGATELFVSYLPEYLNSPLRLVKVICEAAGSSVIIYYLIERRVSTVKMDIARQLRVIRDTNILSAVFETSLDEDTVTAWSNFIQSQKLSVKSSHLSIVVTKAGTGVEAILSVNSKMVALRTFAEERPILIGPVNTGAWSLETLNLEVGGQPRDPMFGSSERSQVKTYELSAIEGEEVDLRAVFKRRFGNIVTDNHVFTDGAHKCLIDFDIDSRLLNIQPRSKRPIDIGLPQSGLLEEWEPPMVPNNANRDVEYRRYRCRPNRSFLPYQGFSYTIAWT